MHRSTLTHRRDKLGLVAAKKLEAARDALHSYRMACIDCGDLAATHDRRHSLVGELGELSSFIESACKAGMRKEGYSDE